MKKDLKQDLLKLVIPFEVRSMPTEGTDYGVVEGYASVFNVKDSYGTFFDKGAFQKSLAENNIKILWQHDWDQPIGRVIEAREDNYGLFVRYQLSLGVQKADEVFQLIKEQIIDSMSIGGWVRTEAIENEEWHIKEFNLIEVSPVVFPANKQAMITTVRSFDPRNQAPLAKEEDDLEAVNLIRIMTLNAKVKNLNLKLASKSG